MVFGPGIWAGLPASRRGRTGPGERADADHVLKGGREPQPSRERVDGLAVQQPSARRVGSPLELEGDAHRLGLVHTGQQVTRGGASRHGATLVFSARRARPRRERPRLER